MATSSTGAALVVSCPTADLTGLAAVLRQSPVALLPVGGVGDLGSAAGVTALLLVEIGPEGPRAAITWQGSVADATPLEPHATRLLPASWVARHPDAFELSRTPRARVADGATGADPSADEDDDEQGVQIFLPVSALAHLPRDRWLFANELVSKQQREGRTFAPRVPAIVALPDA